MFEQGSGRKTKVNGLSDEKIEMGRDHAMIAYLIELEYDGQTMKCVCTSTWVKDDEQ